MSERLCVHGVHGFSFMYVHFSLVGGVPSSQQVLSSSLTQILASRLVSVWEVEMLD